ncbi:MAG: transketolase [Saprospiraceae bacterium]|nr:transketolase [Saprospiraceae bacterium]
MSNYSPIETQLSSIKGDSEDFKREVIKDLWICLLSREVSLLGRKEVLGGKAKFGILGDGKELPQVAMARAFQKGDYRSGYYRDQTFMFALDLCSVQNYFAQLYADPANDPFSGGRQMNAHFATPYIDDDNNWLDLTSSYNVSADISPTSGQMARALGLALASKHYRLNPDLNSFSSKFSKNGNEISFVTIGDASTSEGVFWETMNAAAVQQVPLAVFVWDDGYGISVPIELQTVKQNISKALSGFEIGDDNNGIRIYTLKAWDYPNLVNQIQEGINETRDKHIPVLFHIQEVTQPQGHSTSGSHERYKSPERLEWESSQDCIQIFIKWILENNICKQEFIEELQLLARNYVKEQKSIAWKNSLEYPISIQLELVEILNSIGTEGINFDIQQVSGIKEPTVHELLQIARRISNTIVHSGKRSDNQLLQWVEKVYKKAEVNYHHNLIAEGKSSYKEIQVIHPHYESSTELNGYQIINKYFNEIFEADPRLLAFGEDVGQIGDVNQGFAGMQENFGDIRVFDTGIREWTIIGQAIGLSMRGLRPIAEMQYLDYVIYALSALSDDLATVRYRSNGIQQAPAIIRTRGHRLEGIWHSGSPIGMLLHSLRGIHICVPRNFVQAAGIYNTLLASQDPGLVIECLNGYRLKEICPSNLKTFTVPLGKVEILQAGTDLTLVTYGSTIRIAESALTVLSDFGISVELIDVQTLLPFDDNNEIAISLRKTNKLVVIDEDVPGGASAYILERIFARKGNFQLLDAEPMCISAYDHRPPYGSDGDYFTKPNMEDIIEKIYQMMHEYNPSRYNKL